MGFPLKSRRPEPNTNATESNTTNTTNTISPSHSDSLLSRPRTPETNQERSPNHWFQSAQALSSQKPTTSASTTPRQKRTSPRKIHTPVSRTTPCGSIQKPISSDHLTKHFSILSLNREHTSTPNASPTRRPEHTFRDMWAEEQIEAAIDEANAPSGTPTAQAFLLGSPPPSPDAEYTSDEGTLDSTAYTPPPSCSPSPQSTSLMSLDRHLCCWKTSNDPFDPIMCAWESLSHEDLWRHVVCDHLIEVVRGKLICCWVCEDGGREIRLCVGFVLGLWRG
ncbi:hypothetical protein BDV97DRAFT_351256 [Delphinella strobiligena]|nr:hypothetical protein BDV97DRAFT_351256 [Delphinella strobiligena]